MKRLTAALLAALMLFSAAACDNTDQPVTENVTTDNDTVTEKETTEMTDAETETPIVDEDPVFYENAGCEPLDPDKVDFTGTDWSETIANANEKAPVQFAG